MAVGEQFFYINNRIIDVRGLAVGAQVYFYLTGTTTLRTVYADVGLTTPLANPFTVAAGAAIPNIYLDPSIVYRVRIVATTGQVIDDLDPYDALNAASLTFIQSGTGAVTRTIQAKLRERVSVFDFMSAAQIAAVQAGTSTNDTLALLTAADVAGKEVFMPAGTYRLADASLPTGKRLIGEGVDRTVVKIVAGSTGRIFGLAARDHVEISNMTIDGTDSNDDNNVGVYLSACADANLSNLKFVATGGSSIWSINSPRLRADNITVLDITDVNSWAIHIQGANSAGAILTNLLVKDCNTRAVMVRDVDYVQVHNVTCFDNWGTALWFQNTSWCLGSNIIDHGDRIGDTVVIDGDCVGVWIRGVTAKGCGGHGASIAGNAVYAAAPSDCHIVDCYFEDQGECLAAISDQGSGYPIRNCSIRNVHGKNCGMGNDGGAPIPSEGFAISNGIGCVITGSITDTAGNMPYAARETAGSGPSSNNRFEIDSWVSGTVAYGSLSSSASMITLPKLDNGFERVGNADLSWAAGVNRRRVLYDQAALTADRTVTLGTGWANLKVTVVRTSVASGVFNLLVKQGATTLATLAVSRWQTFMHDGVNWNPVEGGTV